MAAKMTILDELGEPELLLPNLVNEALAANDRAKYLMTLLQTARGHADQPGTNFTDLKEERLACDLTEGDLDEVVEHSHKESDGIYHLPRAGHVHELLGQSVREMLAPLRVRVASGGEDGEAAAYGRRLEALLAEEMPLGEDRVTAGYIDRVTSGRREEHDSLHVLVMDLHRELNRLQQQIAQEEIDGASVYGVEETDRPLIAAFMAGLNRTKALKFDHPGLGTTATRAGKKLVLQNDIGTTDAHVLVVHVEPPRVTVVHTDIHLQRLVFFQDLFASFGVQWEDTQSKRSPGTQDELYHLCRGTYTARDGADLEAFLRFLGSRLVFLIDWNRARKRLRKLAPKRVCLEVLRRAADQDYGHRGFLELGGEQLIFNALQLSGKAPLQMGGQLADILGPEKTAEFLHFTLRTCAEGLLAGRSEFLIRDEVRAELRHYIETAHEGMLQVAGEHAAFIVELAMAARDSLSPALAPPDDREYGQRIARQAKKWEHLADELVNKGRAAREGGADGRVIPELLRVADDAADELEEAVFLLTLQPSDMRAEVSPALRDLVALLVQGAQEYLKAVENARRVHRASTREQIEDFLEAVDRTSTIEHETDDAHRRAKTDILTNASDFKQLHLFAEIADHLEEAADVLMRSALMLRDYILGEVLTS